MGFQSRLCIPACLLADSWRQPSASFARPKAEAKYPCIASAWGRQHTSVRSTFSLRTSKDMLCMLRLTPSCLSATVTAWGPEMPDSAPGSHSNILYLSMMRCVLLANKFCMVGDMNGHVKDFSSTEYSLPDLFNRTQILVKKRSRKMWCIPENQQKAFKDQLAHSCSPGAPRLQVRLEYHELSIHFSHSPGGLFRAEALVHLLTTVGVVRKDRASGSCEAKLSRQSVYSAPLLRRQHVINLLRKRCMFWTQGLRKARPATPRSWPTCRTQGQSAPVSTFICCHALQTSAADATRPGVQKRSDAHQTPGSGRGSAQFEGMWS